MSRPALASATFGASVLLFLAYSVAADTSPGAMPPRAICSFAFVSRSSNILNSARAGPTFVPETTSPKRGQMEMKVSRGKSRNRKDTRLNILNAERKRNAGRRGTKRFVDPGKVFIGNLPFTADDDAVLKWLGEQLGGTHNIASVKIVRNWKTDKSKGFGFIMFTDPIFATSAMETIRGRKFEGRVINLNQGQKKVDPNVLYVKKRKEKSNEEVDGEEMTIERALDEAESVTKDDDEEGSEEVSAEDSYTVGDFDSILDNEMLWDEEDEEEDEDLENFVYDGVFELEYAEELSNKGLSDDEDTKDMNRKQRREAAKNKPKRKLPHKGFGPQVKT